MKNAGVEIREGTAYFGYVYMWCDMKRNMFYIGSHQGSIFDKYTSGSKWLNDSIKKRPETFKMLVLEYYFGEDRRELYNIETKWLKFYNVEKNKAFYNFKNDAVGGTGPSKHKGKKRVEYTPGWVDHRKGKTAEEIYRNPEEFRERLTQILREEYERTGCGRKKGKKHKHDARKGKTVEEIYGYRRLANPERPFIVTVCERFEEPYEIYCGNEREFYEKTKMDTKRLQKLKNDGSIEVVRVQNNSRHLFRRGTILKLKFVRENAK